MRNAAAVVGAVTAILAMVMVGCSPTQQDIGDPPLQFLERMSIPARGDALWARLTVQNTSDDVIEATRVTFIGEPGVTAVYEGYTDCRDPGCIAMGVDDADTRRKARASIDGRLPLRIPPAAQDSRPLALVVRIVVDRDTLGQGCKAVGSAVLTVGGSELVVRPVAGETTIDVFTPRREGESAPC